MKSKWVVVHSVVFPPQGALFDLEPGLMYMEFCIFLRSFLQVLWFLPTDYKMHLVRS